MCCLFRDLFLAHSFRVRFKVCLVGTYDAGKSSIVKRLTVRTDLALARLHLTVSLQQDIFEEGEVLTDGRPVRLPRAVRTNVLTATRL